MKIGLLFIIHLSLSSIIFSQQSLNQVFESSKGSWKFPLCRVIKFDRNNEPFNESIFNKGVTFIIDTISLVNAVFRGTIVRVEKYDSLFVAILKFGDYFLAYAGLSKMLVCENDKLKAGDPIGYVGKDLDGAYCLEFILNKKAEEIDIFPWFAETKK
jgi:murein DD-endopeptidase MepM/ murein hydrolase activator NlpD